MVSVAAAAASSWVRKTAQLRPSISPSRRSFSRGRMGRPPAGEAATATRSTCGAAPGLIGAATGGGSDPLEVALRQRQGARRRRHGVGGRRIGIDRRRRPATTVGGAGGAGACSRSAHVKGCREVARRRRRLAAPSEPGPAAPCRRRRRGLRQRAIRGEETRAARSGQGFTRRPPRRRRTPSGFGRRARRCRPNRYERPRPVW